MDVEVAIKPVRIRRQSLQSYEEEALVDEEYVSRRLCGKPVAPLLCPGANFPLNK